MTTFDEPDRIPCPPPGLYPNVPFEDYTRWDAVNHSTLRSMRRSPAHFLAAYTGSGKPETESKALGTATHCLLFEPAVFAQRLVAPPINPKTDRPYGRDTKAFEEYAAQHRGKYIMSDDEVADMRGMVNAIRANEDAWGLLGANGQSELCIVWDQPTTKGAVRCKCRVDRLVQDATLNRHFGWVDLKTTEDASPPIWRRSVVNYGYHTQHAMIDLACRAHGLAEGGVFVAVESSVPYGVSVYQIGEDTANLARSLVLDWLYKVAECRLIGAWPGYYPRIQQIDAPEWYLKSFGDAMDE